MSARLTNCVKALQQSSNRFFCTSVPCSGALVASASSSSDGQQQQQEQQEQQEADVEASPETGQAKRFHLRTATRLLNMIMRSIAGSSSSSSIRSTFGVAKEARGNCRRKKEESSRRQWRSGRREREKNSAQSQEVKPRQASSHWRAMLRTCLGTKTNSPIHHAPSPFALSSSPVQASTCCLPPTTAPSPLLLPASNNCCCCPLLMKFSVSCRRWLCLLPLDSLPSSHFTLQQRQLLTRFVIYRKVYILYLIILST